MKQAIRIGKLSHLLLRNPLSDLAYPLFIFSKYGSVHSYILERFCPPLFIRYALSIGVKVKDTKAETSTAAAMTTPNSRNNLPTNPSKKITGKNTAANVMDIEITANIISFEPLMAASIGDIPSSTFL